MGRNNRSVSYPRGEGALRANREQRDGRVLKVLRRLDSDDTSIINGAVLELVRDNTIPPVKPLSWMAAFLLDPRLLPGGNSRGFMSGSQIGQVKRTIERRMPINRVATGWVGNISVLPHNRRTILMEVDSEDLRDDRRSVYKILGENGVKGFCENGQRKGHREAPIQIAVASFVQPIARSAEDEAMEAISAGVELNLVRANGAAHLQFAKIQVSAPQSG